MSIDIALLSLIDSEFWFVSRENQIYENSLLKKFINTFTLSLQSAFVGQ